MRLTESQIEEIADRLKACGFDVSDLENDQIAIIAACVLEGLGIDSEKS